MGYYNLTEKEGGFILRLIDLCLDYPEESRPSLLGIKQVLESNYKTIQRRKKSKEEKLDQSNRMKELWEKRRKKNKLTQKTDKEKQNE